MCRQGHSECHHRRHGFDGVFIHSPISFTLPFNMSRNLVIRYRINLFINRVPSFVNVIGSSI